jgi:hypothetical protein
MRVMRRPRCAGGLIWLGLLTGCSSGAPRLATEHPPAPFDGTAMETAAPAVDGAGADVPMDVAVVAADALPADTAPPVDPVLAARATAIAAAYQGWGRIDDELRWAPFLCRIPLPGRARASTSMDATTHGQKLYSVFVKNRAAYPDGPHAGQVVVKESWLAERVTAPDAAYAPEKYRDYPDGGDHFYPYAEKDGALYRASAPAGLYLMFKDDPPAPNSDDGWIYATLTAAGQVTAAGRVESCIECHKDAGHDRLFGVAKSP